MMGDHRARGPRAHCRRDLGCGALWFSVGVLVLIIPAALAGAKLSELRNRSTA